VRALAVASFHTLSRTEMLLLRASLRRLLLGNSRGSLRPNSPPRDADQYEEYLQRAEDFDLRRDWRPFMIWAE
jgi:hypothetical protein